MDTIDFKKVSLQSRGHDESRIEAFGVTEAHV